MRKSGGLTLVVAYFIPFTCAVAQQCATLPPIKPSSQIFRYQEGAATLVGYSEFTPPGTSPRKYLKRTLSGGIEAELWNAAGTARLEGPRVIDAMPSISTSFHQIASDLPSGYYDQLGTVSGTHHVQIFDGDNGMRIEYSFDRDWPSYGGIAFEKDGQIVGGWNRRDRPTGPGVYNVLAYVTFSGNFPGPNDPSWYGTMPIGRAEWRNVPAVVRLAYSGEVSFDPNTGAEVSSGRVKGVRYLTQIDQSISSATQNYYNAGPGEAFTLDLSPTGRVNRPANPADLVPAGFNDFKQKIVSADATDTLSEPDTEEDAEHRAVVTGGSSGTCPAAFATSRGPTEFSFQFRRVTYQATFDVPCPGNYDLVVHYTTKPHGAAGPGTNHVLIERRWLEAGFATVTGEMEAKRRDTDYTVYAIQLEPSCADEPAGNGTFELGSVKISLSLGKDVAGLSAGALRIVADAIGPALFTPAALIAAIPDTPGVDAILFDEVLRQVKAPQTLADIVVLDAYTYEVRFYATAQIGGQDPSSGLYTIDGTPFVSFRFENPDGAQSGASRVRITETRDGASKVVEYAHDAAISTWTLSTGSGRRLESETRETVNGNAVKTRTVRDETGATISKTSRTYRLFSWGEELIEEILDPDGARLTTRYEYYAGLPATDPNNTRLKQRTGADGSWERFAYDSEGRILETTRPYLDAPHTTTDETQCRVEENTYDTIPDADGDGQAETRTISLIRTLGQETSRRYRIEWSGLVTLGGEPYERRSNIVATAAGAAWNAPENLVTETLTYPDGPFLNRSRRVIRPDGTMVLTHYALDANQVLTITTDTGEPNATRDAIVDGERTLRMMNFAGQQVGETTTDIASGLQISSWTASEFDFLFRPTRLVYSDGTWVGRDYGCCGLEAERDRTGMLTTYDYDALGRQTAVSKDGITQVTAYDPDGRVKSVRRFGTDGSVMMQETNTYDLAGRLIEHRDALNRLTVFGGTFDSATGRTTRTTTHPDGGTTFEVFARDGSRLSIDGTAVAPHTFEHDVENGVLVTKDTAVGEGPDGQPTSTEWAKSNRDFAGRTFKTVYADGAVAQSFYNLAGQVVRQVDPDGVVTLFGYNPRGELEITATDLNANASIDYAGPDRIVRTMSGIAAKLDAGTTYTVQRSATQVWDVDNQDAPVTESLFEESIDQRRAWQTMHGQTTSVQVNYDGQGGRTLTTVAPDGSKTVQRYAGDRLVATTVTAADDTRIAGKTYDYDSHGRLQTSIDVRNGATTYTYWGDDRVHKVTTPDPDPSRIGPGYDPQTTTYTYDATGRLESVTGADGGVVHTSYWPTGDVRRTWGARVWPVEYTYDPQGRLKTLTTWQDFADDHGRTVTSWSYHPQRGWLVSKRYADNTGPSYTYTPSGRLLTHEWARGVSVTCAYDAAGEPETLDYSDDTPDVTITYDRSGRPLTVSDGAGVRRLTYHASGQMEDESYTSGLLNGFSVDRSFDSAGRLSRVAVPSTLAVDYGYDTASRLRTVTNGSNVVSYSYAADSPLVEAVNFKNSGTTRLTRTNSYDRLDRISAIVHGTEAQPMVFRHAYTYNDANQRTAATREDGGYWSYAYDELGQVTSGSRFSVNDEPVPGHAYAWSYDDIGNRRTAVVNGQTTTYTPNALNAYTQVTVPGTIDVLGAAAADASVTAVVLPGAPTPTPVLRQGERFYKQVSVDNSTQAVPARIGITGVKILVGPNGEDAVATVTRSVLVPKTPELFTHDQDGNLTGDARWTYTWDAANRLATQSARLEAIRAENRPRHIAYRYDSLGRRVEKRVTRPGSIGMAIRGSYYDLSDLEGPVVLTEEFGDLDYSRVGAWHPTRPTPVRGYSVRWDGTLRPPASGLWTLKLEQSAGHGYRLWLDGQLCLSQWPASSTGAAQTVDVTLEAGRDHALRIDFSEPTLPSQWTGIARLKWTGPGVAEQLVPAAKSSTPASDETVEVTRYLYDGWNLIAEVDGAGVVQRTYTWGLDLSGSMQSAGGVGGLLGVTDARSGATHLPAFDGNGNVAGLVASSDGRVSARYDYTAFGEIVQIEGPAAEANPFRFSTKYTDAETRLIYYGLRYYSPTLGRWQSRDPIEEEGGLHLYAMVSNNPSNRTDPLGLFDGNSWRTPTSVPNLPLKPTPSIPGTGLNVFRGPQTGGGMRGVSDGPIYGYWGGKNWSGGPYGRSGAADSSDEAYRRHDECYAKCSGLSTAKTIKTTTAVCTSPFEGCQKQCDQQLVEELRELPRNPRDWPKPPQDASMDKTARRFADAAITFFK